MLFSGYLWNNLALRNASLDRRCAAIESAANQDRTIFEIRKLRIAISNRENITKDDITKYFTEYSQENKRIEVAGKKSL